MLPLVTLLLLPRDALALHAGATSRPPAAGCRDAIPGEWCHSALVWARDKGARQHPDWFPGDAGQYTARDFQSLLHQLGAAQCPPPCPPGPDPRPLALGLLQTEAAPPHGFGGGELEAVMESTWAPTRAQRAPARAFDAAAGAPGAGCEDAVEGGLCHHSVTWLRESGFARHPEWYPGLSSDTPFEDVQMVLSSLGKAGCREPCGRVSGASVARRASRDVLEVEPSGREMHGREVVLAAPRGCGNATAGDWCSMSIQWLRRSGLAEHPEWYPSLGHASTDREVQAELFKQGKVGCPEPCPEWRPGMARTPPSGRLPSTTSPPSLDDSCTDAAMGSACFDEVMGEIRRLKAAPDQFAAVFSEVQGRLYRSRKAGCARPCPALHSKRVVNERGYMKKPVETMTVDELKAYFDGHWDGMVPASTQKTAEASTTEAAFSEDAAAEIAAENASDVEPRAPEQASSEENDIGDSNISVMISSSQEGSTAKAGRDGEGLEGRIPEGSTPNRATAAAAESATQEPLPYVGEDAAAASAADDQEATQETPQDATRQAPHDATQEGSVAGAAPEASPQPGAASGADDLKAELEKLKAENDALKLSADLEKLRTENQALKLRAKPKAKRMVYPEPMPMIATDEVLSPGEWEELLRKMSVSTTRAESPA